ncbi:T-cell-specific surface glycoprotein CD28 [Perognathus longimembris pacificus]|uniref:T-cell-specific surface glycoprotein CD28 n=1 Tax=Perognathus longimembris pacificus TaxID=214514 RepID=UPI0020194D3D|nr:T-cell-specific surface glycoprotein CD28 [Perognathus longimembris pacificus]
MMLRLLLLALNFFPSIQVTENTILVKQSPLLVVDDNEVNLSCKYTYNLFSKEFKASLHKGLDNAVEVCFVDGNFSHQLQFHSNTGFNCDGNLSNETVTFYLRNLYINQTDIYFCKIEVKYPPPYLSNERSNGTIIHITEKHHCPEHQPSEPKPFWVLVVVDGILAFYSFLVTVALCVFWMNSKTTRLLQSDYMNMTPRRPGPTRRHYQPYAPTRDFAAYRP